ASDYANRKKVLNTLLSALPVSRMVHLRTPLWKEKMVGTTKAITQSQAYNGSNRARLAHHNDCFLASATDEGTYTNTSVEYPYLHNETKYLAMGGETCALNPPRTDCSKALSELKYFHWSYLNTDYNSDVLKGFISGGCMDQIKKSLGYRFELVNGTFTQSANIGGSFPLALTIRNSAYSVRMANNNLWEPNTGYNNLNFTMTLANAQLDMSKKK
ncbi:hypothetical protein FO519_009428, partial [Halicephalobus sp. NKZ332]